MFLHLSVILYTGGLCPEEGSLCTGGQSLSGTSLSGGSLSRGFLSRGVSVQGSLSGRPPQYGKDGKEWRYVSYWNAFLLSLMFAVIQF